MDMKTSDGVTLFVEKKGQGVPCIYLHGGPGYWSKSFSEFAGNLLIEEMEMVFLDQRGCGRSELASNGDYSLDRLLQDIEEVRDHLGFEQWYVMGHSFGGILAVNYAKRYPERVKGVILSNVTLDMKASFGHQIAKGRELLGVGSLDLPRDGITQLLNIFYETVQQLVDRDIFYKLHFQSLADKDKLDEIDVEIQMRPDFQQFVFSSEVYFQDFRELTSSISAPVLVLSGKYDDAIGLTHSKSFNFTNAVYKVLESGHHPYLDNPVDFKNTIVDFINA